MKTIVKGHTGTTKGKTNEKKYSEFIQMPSHSGDKKLIA